MMICARDVVEWFPVWPCLKCDKPCFPSHRVLGKAAGHAALYWFKPVDNIAVARAYRRIDKMPINFEKSRQRILAEKMRLEADRARISEHNNNAQSLGEMVGYDMNQPRDPGIGLVESQ